MKLPGFIRSWLIRRCTQITKSRQCDVFIGGDYLERWWVIPRNKWFNVYLHVIHKSDDDRALHDHPWVNCSLLLRGTYTEMVPDQDPLHPKAIRREEGQILFRRASQAHRLIIEPALTPPMTLFITGPVVRSWGFYCPQGWKPWERFTAFSSGGSRYDKGPGCGD